MTKNFFTYPQPETNKFFDEGFTKLIETRYPELTRVSGLSVSEFHEQYVQKGKPVVLTGLGDEWQAMSKWNLPYFREHCADVPIKVNIYDIHSSYQTTIGRVIDEWKDTSKNDYMQEWWFGGDCPFLEKDFSIPEYFVDDLSHAIFKFYSCLLYMGKKNAYTYIHQDTPCTNVWSAQMSGKKQWILFGRDAFMPVRADGLPDVEAFLADPKSEIAHCTLLPGEVLFVPYKWWHRVRVIEDSISLHVLYVTQEILSRFMRDLFAIPLLTAINYQDLLETNPMRLDVNMMTCNALAKLMGLRIQKNEKST